MFPDSAVAKQFHCSHTKTSVLTRFGNGKYSLDQLIQRLILIHLLYFLAYLLTNQMIGELR